MIELVKKYNNLSFSLIFTIGSLLLARTLVFPIIVLFPSFIIEYIVSLFIDNGMFIRIGQITIVILFIFAVILIRKSIQLQRNNIPNNIIVFWTFLLLQFIIHPLGFYIYWGIMLNFKSDGQLFFISSDSIMLSSLFFIPIGIILDILKISNFPNFTKTQKEL